jgi:carbamoyl-phosphate synthase large subunit
MPRRNDIKKVMIIGSGPIVIGQACEFDYSGTQACKALRRLGYEIVLVNSNPATIMTDPGMADVTYIEPLNLEAMTKIIEKERPDALLPNLGGQSGLNLSSELAVTGVLDKYGVKVIGVQVDAIKRGEDRGAFKDTMNRLKIEMPKSDLAFSVEEAERIAEEIGYPVILRPAYTMGGTGGGRYSTWRSCASWRRAVLRLVWCTKFSWRNRCWGGRSWNWKWFATPRVRR